MSRSTATIGRRLGITVAVLSLAVLPGCTGDAPEDDPTSSASTDSSSTGAGDAEFDACGLFPEDDVESILGTTEVAPGTAGGWAAGTCTLNAEGAGLLISVGTEESFADAGDPAATDPATRFEAHEQEVTGGGEEPTSVDVGEGAFVHAGGGAAHADGVYIEIVAPGAPADEVEQVLALGVANATG